MRILGIDPGSRKLGLAVVQGEAGRLEPVAFATVRLKEASMGDRLLRLFDEVCGWVEGYEPDEAALEEVFVSRNARSALVLGQARGAALLALARRGVAVTGYPPARIKKAVGSHGRARKEEMRRMVRLQLGLASDPSEDAADALAVAVTRLVMSWSLGDVEPAW